MSPQVQNFVNEFVMMWVLIDPIGTVPVYLLATRGMQYERQRQIAIRASLVAAAVSVEMVLSALAKYFSIPGVPTSGVI